VSAKQIYTLQSVV